jgi:hypothetical protein
VNAFRIGLIVPAAAMPQVEIKNIGPCVPMAGTSVMAQLADDKARISTIKGQSFSADGVVTFDQKLPEGNAIHGIRTSHLARDGGGRTRTDTITRCWLGADGEFHAAWRVDVIDPASRTSLTWSVDDLTPKVVKVHHILEAKPLRADMPEQVEARKIQDLNEPPKSESVSESLGVKTIEGFSVEGHRVTHTIPVGEAGNDRPMKSIEENWWSEQLKQVVLAIDDNPTQGRTEMRLKDVRLGEPDPALFSPPEGYKIEDVPRN